MSLYYWLIFLFLLKPPFLKKLPGQQDSSRIQL